MKAHGTSEIKENAQDPQVSCGGPCPRQLRAAMRERCQPNFQVTDPALMLVLPGAEAAMTLQLHTSTKEKRIMAMYVSLVQFTDQGVRNVKDTVKRSEAAMAEAEKMGMKIVQPLWTMGAYDVVVLLEAPNDETMSAFTLKIGSMGSVKTHTMRAFTKDEMAQILAKIQ